MKVTHRLYLAAVPSVLGVIAVAALAYWGQFARTVPESLVIVAAIATVGSMVWSWINVRYVAERVERLAHRESSRSSGNAQGDELDAIEGVVAELSTAVRSEQTGRRDDQAALGLRRTQYARVLSDIAESAILGMNDIRLPLHILLENHFGELNENQEEMLGAARTAAELIDRDLEALQELARLDLGEIQLRTDRIFPADLLHAILPSLGAVAEARGVMLKSDIAALVPPIESDAIRLQGALLTLLSQHIAALPSGSEVEIVLNSDSGRSAVTLSPGAEVHQSVQLLLARRILTFAGGSVEAHATSLRIQLPG